MDSVRLDRSSAFGQSLTVSHEKASSFLKVWHLHEELELVYILQSSGMRFVGDSIEKFKEGDLVLLGKNLPHMWLNDDKYFVEGSTLNAEAIAIHFKEDFLGFEFWKVPEMHQVSKIFPLAFQGVKYLNPDRKLIHELIRIPSLDDTSRLIKTIEILHRLSMHKEIQTLSSVGFLNSFQQSKDQRLNSMYEFIFQNFKSPIGSGDVAEVIGMNKSAFSRFFSKIHRKSFTRYLNGIRIGYACKLLIDQKQNITSIAYSCGFNNISNFNRQFKLIKGLSPSEYINSLKGQTKS